MNNNFNFSYSLKERQEIEEIRRKYIAENDKGEKTIADKIKFTDKKNENTACLASIIFGMIMLKIFSVGMTLCFKDEVYSTGIFVVILGLLGMSLTPLLHKIMLQSLRKISSKKILSLIDEYLDMTK